MPISSGDKDPLFHVERMCSWCHEMTHLIYCPNCGHDATVPRMMCQCTQCKASRDRMARARSPYR